MFGYYFDLALRSLRRNKILTALMVLSVSVGIALAMSSWTLVRLMSRDPIPEKSARLFVPTVDMWGPSDRGADGEPPSLLDYDTATTLLRDHRATYQSAIYWVVPTVLPSRQGMRPFNASGFAVTGEFFPMLDAPFEYGSGWSDADDAARAPVAVISRQLNDKLFGGVDSVGKSLDIDGQDYRVVGVLGDFETQPAYFDVPAFGGYMTQPTALFLPFNTAIAAQMPAHGSQDCQKSPKQPGFAGLLHSSCIWISYMAQLNDARAASRYRDYLAGLARQRYDWPPNVRLRSLMAWLDYMQVVPDAVRILRLVGIGLLVVCLVNTIGLMLAKFLRRSGEIGIRRAMGASRRTIYQQFLTEAAVIGMSGGVLGLGLTWLSMRWLRSKFPQSWEVLTHVDVRLLTTTLAVAVLSTLLAALYPAFRSAHVKPAWQIKSQ